MHKCIQIRLFTESTNNKAKFLFLNWIVLYIQQSINLTYFEHTMKGKDSFKKILMLEKWKAIKMGLDTIIVNTSVQLEEL